MEQDNTSRFVEINAEGQIVPGAQLSDDAVSYDRFVPGEGVPTREIKMSSEQQRSRANNRGGVFQRARDAEKQEVINILKELNKPNKVLADLLNINWEEYIFGLPNAKWGWINAFFKRLLTTDQPINTCDQQLFLNMWMTPKALETTKKLFAVPAIRRRFDREGTVFARFPTRSKMPMYCDKGVLKMNLKNPGVLNLYTGEVEHYPNMQSMYDEIAAYNKYDGSTDWSTGRVKQEFLPKCSPSISINQTPSTTMNDCSCHETDEAFVDLGSNYLRKLSSLRDEYESKLKIHQETSALDFLDADDKYKKLIDYVRDTLYEKHIPWNKFMEITKAFNSITAMQESKYILSLINPFQHRLTKIPSEFPIPTSSFSIRHNFNLTTNASGNVALAYSPFFLAVSGATNSSLAVNNDVSLTGSASSNFFLGLAAGQVPPANFYSRYRLVSAGLKITFTSSELNSTGFCTVGIDFVDAGVTSVGIANTVLAQYGDFSLIENTYFKDSKATRSGDSLQLNYIPLDSSYLDFASPGVGRTAFQFLAYVAGAQASTVVARVDIVANYEGTVANGFTDFLPCQVYTGELEDLKFVSSALSGVKNANAALSPANLEKALLKNDSDKPQVIVAGQPKQSIQQALEMVNVLNELSKHTTDQIKEKIEDPDKKKSWLNKAMDYTAPIASHIMQAALGALGKKYTLPKFK